MELKVGYEHLSDTVTVVTVEGEPDVYEAPKLHAVLIALIDQGRHHLVIDMSGVHWIDSTCLGVLVGALRRVRRVDGGLALAPISKEVLVVLRITGLMKVFERYGSVARAEEALTHAARRRTVTSTEG
ncbi:STAS domain-containing protein [Streptomyces sp. SAJ15]|uniref:STAS domain-containing protein n=1 Tax=Streptomyces sp. SAJ15 TaxID=2011095 RepID=UPI00118689EC|nr:STAS domain-containing protein [Streptomyces sp. SAJ15]TVL91880.1 anti-sigma B factor antagonist [Streptomyces sp. SAJ15]